MVKERDEVTARLERIVEAIRPLPATVRPGNRFLTRTRTQLLALATGPAPVPPRRQRKRSAITPSKSLKPAA
jgi:hypothetical protein